MVVVEFDLLIDCKNRILLLNYDLFTTITTTFKTKWIDEDTENKSMWLAAEATASTASRCSGVGVGSGDSSLLNAAAINASQIENSKKVCPHFLGYYLVFLLVYIYRVVRLFSFHVMR